MTFIDVTICGCDPGFANIGLSTIVASSSGKLSLVDTKFVSTKSSSVKKTKQIDDEIRRLHEIEATLIGHLDKWRPDILAIEEPGKCLMRRTIAGRSVWQTNPTLLRTSCLMWGAVSGICSARGILLAKFGSQEIKKVVCQSNKASKAQMIKEVKRRFCHYKNWSTASSKVEHEVDSVGAAMAAAASPFVVSLFKDLNDRKRSRVT